jgi:putative peptidoglycan lipid II flippase
MFREMLRAEFFGVTPFARAYIIALKIPNTLRNLVAEGALSQAFIPVFAEYLQKNKDSLDARQAAYEMANTIISVSMIAVFGIVIIGELFAPFIVRLLSFQWQMDETMVLTTRMTRIMFPYVFFLSIASLFMGILNTFKEFTAPALSSVVLNGTVILFYLLALPHLNNEGAQVQMLSIGVVLGGILQLVLQIITARRMGFRFAFIPNFRHPAIKSIVTIMIPAIFGSGVYQLNQFIDVILASYLERFVPGAVASLEYAVRLMQFPLGAFGIAIATVILPRLSLLLAKDDRAEYKNTMAQGYSLIAFITFPAMAGMIILARPIIHLILERGAFDAYSTEITTLPLVFYSMGIFSYSCVKVTVAAFFSLKDSKTPVKIAALTLLFNLLLSVILMQFLHHAGLALAATIGSFLQWGSLLYILRRRLEGRLHLKQIVKPIIKNFLATLIMALLVLYLRYLPPAWLLIFGKFQVLLIILLGGILYFTASLALQVENMKEIIAMIRKK